MRASASIVKETYTYYRANPPFSQGTGTILQKNNRDRPEKRLFLWTAPNHSRQLSDLLEAEALEDLVHMLVVIGQVEARIQLLVGGGPACNYADYRSSVGEGAVNIAAIF